MTDLSGFPTLASASRAAGAVAEANASKSAALSSDFETFLKMLTVQMRNQDPLNPVEATDYAVQLATFSSVEQQVLTNSLLQRLLSQSGGGLEQMSQWVGMEVRAPGPVSFDGQSVTLWAEPSPAADGAALIVRDSYGSVVARYDIPVTPGLVQWDGVSEFGDPMLHGDYRFEIQSYSGEALLGSRPAEAYSRILEARLDRGEVVLLTSGGHLVRSDAVTALRLP